MGGAWASPPTARGRSIASRVERGGGCAGVWLREWTLARRRGSWRGRTEFMGTEVQQLQPGRSVSLNSSTLGFPLKNVRELPAGDYYVQALLNVYTKFERADGHTIWGHMDQWEGQKFNRSPGNLYSPVQRVHLDPLSGYDVRLSLTETISPVQVPSDSPYVKRIKI